MKGTKGQNVRVILPRMRPLSAEEQRMVDEERARAQAEDAARQREAEGNHIWFKAHAQPGVVVIVEHSWRGLPNELYLDIITRRGRGRFATECNIAWNDRFGGSYYFSGQSATTPKGQARVLHPTPERLRAALAQVNTPRIQRHQDPPALVEAARRQLAEMEGCNGAGES